MQNPYAANQSPDLSLAQMPDVASGSSLASMPLPLPAIPREQPMLQCSDPGMELNQMGIVDNVPYFDLRLAQSPDLGMVSNVPQVNEPTFSEPNFAVPANRPYDLQEPGIDQIPEFSVDPQVGDLMQFAQPHGLSLFAVNRLDPLSEPVDPLGPDLLLYDRPDNLMLPLSMAVDPTLPDLQAPMLKQEVHMPDRPGDMVDSAGDAPELGPDGDNDDDDGPMPPYNKEYQEPGLSYRQRRMDRLYRGLRGDL